jgi:hypothetical protein
MWMLNFIPDSWFVAITNLVLLVSASAIAATWLLSKVPFIAGSARVIRIIAVLLLLGAVYFKGSLENELVWRARVAELEEKVKIAEEKSKQTNTVIETKVVTKTKVVRDTQVVIQEKIKEVERVIDAKCEVDPVVIQLLNEAATMPGEDK